jgi:hypothetical protein
MRKRNDIYISELLCGECGAVFPIPRKKGERREQGHIKDLWCFRCKKITKFWENEPNEGKN